MLAWSPDTTHQKQIAGGYWYPDGAIEGFSLTHFSGRGVPCLKDIPFMPVIQPVTVSPGANWSLFAAPFSHANESASPGCYRVKFDNGIETELTATPRTGLARFTFPVQSTATLLVRADSADAKTSEVFVVVLKPGEAPPPHKHDDTEQIFYVLEGRGILRIDAGKKKFPVKTGDVVRIPPKTIHSIQCVGKKSLHYLVVDCFVGGRPKNEPTWDSHVRAMCRRQKWCAIQGSNL